jgi:hypothetical protein
MTSSSEEDILMYTWLKLRKRRKRKWIHNFNESCVQHGAYVLAQSGEIPVLLSNVPRILQRTSSGSFATIEEAGHKLYESY